jgi:hypothetical protein
MLMQRRALVSLALVSVTATSCIVPEDTKPDVAFGATLATKFVHRGMTLVDNPVLQPELAIEMPTNWGDRIGLAAEASMDLRNDTGGAWFPDGHAGRFTQIEFQGSYERRFGDLAIRGGVHSYNLPNGLEFPNGERGGTTEAFVRASAEVLEANPYVSVHYDFDEVRGAYYVAGIAEDIPIDEKWSIALDGSIGYVSEAQAAWMYGIGESGFADLRGEIVLKYRCDPRTQLHAGVHGSLIVDDTLDDWFRDLRIDDDPIWFSFGVAWFF